MEKAELTLAFTQQFNELQAPLRLVQAKPDRYGDLVVEIELPRGARLSLTCLMVNRGAPERLNQALRRRAQIFPVDRVAVVAPSWSKPALDYCRQNDIAAFDLDGNRVLKSRTARFDRLDQPRRASSPTPSDYSGKAAAIAITLLREPDKIRTQTQIAHQSGVDQSWVSRVAKSLVERDCVEINRVNRRGIKVVSPACVLDACQQTYSPKVMGGHSRTFSSAARVDKIERLIADYCNKASLPYAFTAYSAAARHASVGPYDRVVVYVDDDSAAVDLLADKLDLRPARHGNVVIWRPSSPVVMSAVQRLRSDCVVDPVLCYLDMWVMPGRGRDHARAFRATALPEDFV